MEATGFALWLNTAFASFDLGVAMGVHNLYTAAGGFFTPFFNFISFLGKDGIILIIASFAMMFFKPTRKYGTVMLFSIIVGALITNCCLKIIIARPRPYADPSSEYYKLWLTVGQAMESDKSFPSGHTTAAMSASMGIFLIGNRKISWTAFIFAFLMGVSRIYLVVHYTTDVLGGVVVGIIGGTVAYIIFRRLPEAWLELDFLDLARSLKKSTKKGAHER